MSIFYEGHVSRADSAQSITTSGDKIEHFIIFSISSTAHLALSQSLHVNA